MINDLRINLWSVGYLNILKCKGFQKVELISANNIKL